jgi:O-antigen/teichoic acid export membrane protein
VLARCLGVGELGVAATAMACFELVRVLANNGIGQMVVAVPEERLAATCNMAYRIVWMLCGVMVVIQVAAGLVIAHLAGAPELLGMIACLAGVYAFMPCGMVQSWLLQRAYRMGAISGINALQVTADNLLTAVLAIMGAGAWAIVVPKLMTAPIWLIGNRRFVTWRPDRTAGLVPVPEMLRFAMPILASEVLVVVRLNVDKVLVGSILGIEALGIYYFAFSAGYGLSLVLTSALAAASYPHLAEAKLAVTERLRRFDEALRNLATPISGIILAQALAVFIYVPLLFGPRWAPMTMIVAVLCLSAATKAWYELGAQLLRAAGMPTRELMASCVFTAAFLASLALGLQFGLLAGVTLLSITTVSMQILFASWARHQVVKSERVSATIGNPTLKSEMAVGV